MGKVGVGIIGSQFAAEIHAQSLKRVPAAELVAVASASKEHARAFAATQSIGAWFTDYHELLALADVHMVTVAVPNYLHCQVVVDAAHAGKHVVCEKPLCLNLEEAERMIQACRENGVKLMYAEQVCFAPKYVRAKELVDSGALGIVYSVKHSGKHFGPHSAWFWDVNRAGGGALLDMGCHGLELARWIFGKPRAVAVYAQLRTQIHRSLTKAEDDALVIVEFEGGGIAVIEASWAKRGGLDDRVEIYGSEGVIYANLIQGNALLTYSERGYDYAMEKAPETKGWSFTAYEEQWNYGYPQEIEHFINCVLDDVGPRENGEDGKAVLEIILAAYESARIGAKVRLPFAPSVSRPIDLYFGAIGQDSLG